MKSGVDGLNLCGFTGSSSRKYKQMQVNKSVAFALNNIQIEGLVIMKGSPLAPENVRFIELFQEKWPEIYQFWRKWFEAPNSGARVFTLKPRRIGVYNAPRAGLS